MKLLVILFSGLLALPIMARPATDKPNIIVFFLDDAGYGHFSHTGNPTIDTPNLSKMVREGMNFPQFYSGSPACSASRYALLTGRNPKRSGLGSWVIGPTAAKHIHTKEVTLAEGLKNRGYATGFFGKWHLGTPNANNSFTADALPLAHGFDTWEGTNVSNDYNTGVDLIKSNPDGTVPVAGYETIAEDILNKIDIHENLTKRYRDRAVQFIQDNKDQPFLLYVAPNMPHLPVHSSDDFKGTSLGGRLGDCIEEIDAMLGTVRSTLESEGISKNTLIIFTSDNGQWIVYENTANHGKYGEARLFVGSAKPFRDGKGSTWEGGVRVPGVFYWPGTILPGTVSRSPACNMDILPTAFALAGEPIPDDRTLDGRDLRPLISPSNYPGTVPDFEYIYTGVGNNIIHAARKGPWKLHIKLYSQTGNNYGFSASKTNPLLFNVLTDPHENSDQSSSLPAEVSTLQTLLDQFETSLNTEGTFWDTP